jgi:hypothetical protein
MSTELDTTSNQEAALTVAANAPASQGTDLSVWVAKLDDASRLGTALSNTAMVPQAYRGKPDDCASVVFMGAALGMNPLEALQDIFVVHGTPGLYARAMHKLFNKAGHELVRTAATNESVTVAARRRGTDEWHEFTWTIERAKQAGYAGTNKKYQTDPVAMLTAKAIAEAVRLTAPEVLSGVTYSAEEIELEDMGERPSPPKTQPSAGLAAQVEAAQSVDTSTGEVADRDWYAEMEPIIEDAPALRKLYSDAAKHGADQSVLDSIAAAGQAAGKAA